MFDVFIVLARRLRAPRWTNNVFIFVLPALLVVHVSGEGLPQRLPLYVFPPDTSIRLINDATSWSALACFVSAIWAVIDWSANAEDLGNWGSTWSLGGEGWHPWTDNC